MQLKIKLYKVSVNAKTEVYTFAEVVRSEYFSKDVLTDMISSALGILVYNEFKSKKTRHRMSGTK